MNSGQSFAHPWQILETVTVNDPQIVLSLEIKAAILQLCHNSDINAPQTKKNLKIGIKQNSCTVTSIYDDLFFLMVAVLSCQSLNVDHASARKILETLCLKKQEYQDLIRGFPQVGLSDLRNLSLEYMLNDVDNCYGYAIFVADTLKEILRSSTALMLEQKWLMLRSVADYNRKVFSCFALAIPVLGVLRVEDDNDSVCRELLNLILNQESSLSQSSFDEAQRVWRNEILSLWGAADQIDPSTKTGILWGSLYPDSGPIPNMTHNTLAKIFTLCARGETIDQRVDSVFPPAIDFIENQFSELSRPRLSFFRAQQNPSDYVDTIKGWLVPNRDDPPYALALYCLYRKGPILDCEYSLIRQHLAQLHAHLPVITEKTHKNANQISEAAMALIQNHLEKDLSRTIDKNDVASLAYYEPLVKYQGSYLTNDHPHLEKVFSLFAEYAEERYFNQRY